jgi:hypothetical protein
MDFSALLFVPAFVGAVLVGFLFVLVTAHYYLTVLESTGEGSQSVTWTNEPIVECWWKVWYLVWLVGLWFGPAYIVGRVLTAGTDQAWQRLAVPLAMIWLCYPVSQLSSLAASTMWLPLLPDVLLRLLQKPVTVLGFYFLSGGVITLFGLAFHWVFRTADDWHWLVIGAPLLVVSVLLYARLLGRLAFALRFTRDLMARKTTKGKPKSPTKHAIDEVIPTLRQTDELPPIPIDREDEELLGYQTFIDDDPPPPRKKRLRAELVEHDTNRDQPSESRPAVTPKSRFFEEDDEDAPPKPYELRPEIEAPPQEDTVALLQPRADELALLSRQDEPRQPKRVWDIALVAFLVQPGTLVAIVYATVLCMGTGTLIRIARLFYPASGQ